MLVPHNWMGLSPKSKLLELC